MKSKRLFIVSGIFILIILFAWQLATGQPGVKLFNTLHAFGSTASTYGAAIDSAGTGYFGVKSGASTDTLESMVYTSAHLEGEGSLFIHAQRDTASATPDTSYLYMLLWRGDSYGTDGWESKYLTQWGLTNSGNDKSIILSDSTWWTKRYTSKWKFRFIETEADTNIYYLDQFYLQTRK